MSKKRDAIKYFNEAIASVESLEHIVNSADIDRYAERIKMYLGQESSLAKEIRYKRFTDNIVFGDQYGTAHIIANQRCEVISILISARDTIETTGLYKNTSETLLDKVDKLKNLWWLVGGAFGLGLLASSAIALIKKLLQ